MNRQARRDAAAARRALQSDPRVFAWREQGPGPLWLEPGERERMIAEAAYFLAAARGFAPGHALEDWVQAERQIARMIGPPHRAGS